MEIMDMSPKQYQEYLKSINPKSPLWKNVALAFLVGGAICCLGQALSDWYRFLGLKLEDAATATSVSLVFLSALFTGLGLYHKLARHAGAGTLVPITGFANAVASPAIDFRAEGVVTGTAVKMFYRGRAGDRIRHRRQRGVWVDFMGGEVGAPRSGAEHFQPLQ